MTDAIPTIRRYLQTLHPLDRFGAAELDELARKTQIEELPAGRRLFLRGSREPWTFYLLNGTVQLDWPDGHRELLRGDSPAARQPLNDAQPHTATATAIDRIRFIRFNPESSLEGAMIAPSNELSGIISMMPCSFPTCPTSQCACARRCRTPTATPMR